MRVSIIGKFYADSFGHCIAEAFATLGHTVQPVEELSFLPGVTAPSLRFLWTSLAERSLGLRRIASARLVRKVLAFSPDLVLSTSKHLEPHALKEIRKSCAAPAVFWFPDAISNFGRQWFLASPFDLYCFKDRWIVDTLRTRIGLSALLLPDAARSVAALPDPWPTPDCDVLVACNLYPYRVRLLEAAQEFHWRIYGNVPRWLTSPILGSHSGKYLAGEDKIAAYQRAAIVFNSNHPAEIAGINARTFEVCGVGAFLLTDHHPSLQEYFTPEVEVGTYTGIADLPERIRFYLDHPSLRREMAVRAHRRVAREHTYEARLKTLLSVLTEKRLAPNQ